MKARKMLLFDPITGERKFLTFREIAELTGRMECNIRSYNFRYRVKITSINCYVLEKNTPLAILSELMENEALEDEYWKDIDGAIIPWQISSYGRFRYKRAGQKWKYSLPYLKRGRVAISITTDKNSRDMLVQTVVAKYFLREGPEGFKVIHLNGCKWDNRVGNLAYVSPSEASRRSSYYTTSNKTKSVFKIDSDTGLIIDQYDSILDAAKDNYTTSGNIRSALKGIRGHRLAAGFMWRLTEDVPQSERKFKEEL